MSDTYRAGDEDFDWLRERFMDMVRRHLSDCEPTPSKPKGKKERKARRKKEQVAEQPMLEIDGKPIDIGRNEKNETVNFAADAMQWLITKGKLRSPVPHDLPYNERERLLTAAAKDEAIRITTADDLALIFEKADFTPLRSPDLEGLPSGFGPRQIGASKLVNAAILAELGKDIPAPCMEILRAIICRNEFPWHGAGKRDEQRIMQQVRMALDFASWSLDRHHPRPEITEDELVRRWPETAEWFTAKRLRAATLSFKRDRVG